MLKIAICDSDAFICSCIEDLIKDTFKSCRINFEEFSNGLELYYSICDHSSYDIIFMDISSDRINGISTISHIRNNCRKKIIVIYLSKLIMNLEYISDIIDTHPFALITKPIDIKYFTQKILSAFQEIFHSSGFFEFKNHGYIYRIPLDNIIYIEKSGRTLNIITENNVYTTYYKIEDAYNNLLRVSNSLIRIQYSYIVNIRYITRYSLSRIYIGDMEFSISKNYRSDLFHCLHADNM